MKVSFHQPVKPVIFHVVSVSMLQASAHHVSNHTICHKKSVYNPVTLVFIPMKTTIVLLVYPPVKDVHRLTNVLIVEV